MQGLRIAVVSSLLLAGVAGCANDGRLTEAPVADATPTPESSPTPDPQPNATPVAVIDGGATTTLSPLDTIELGGFGSFDPDGAVVVWTWEVLTRPSGSTSEPQAVSANNAFVDFLLDLAGDYTLRLTVFDNDGAMATSEIAFTAVPAQYFHTELTWDVGGSSDVDLHVLEVTAGGTFMSQPYDCYYSNKTPEWGMAGLGDNPRLDLDDTTGFGPENVNIDFPANGSTYRVLVHYYSDAGQGPTEVRIRLYLSGNIVLDETEILTATDKAWSVFDVAWPSGNITMIDQLFDA